MTEADRREIVKAVVEKHWEEMTEAIIMVLAGYAQASYSEGHIKVAGQSFFVYFALVHQLQTADYGGDCQ